MSWVEILAVLVQRELKKTIFDCLAQILILVLGVSLYKDAMKQSMVFREPINTFCGIRTEEQNLLHEDIYTDWISREHQKRTI